MNHAIDFLYSHLGAKLQSEFVTEPALPDDICDCCLRPAMQWLNPSLRVSGKYSGIAEIHCLACHVLYHPSFRFLGQEGFRSGNPTANKLGMLPGCALLVSPDRAVLYAPGKYFAKFEAAPELIFDEIQPFAGKAADKDVFRRQLAPPFLYIQKMSKVKEALLSSLQVTYDPDSIMFCDGNNGYSFESPRSLGRFAEALAESPEPKNWIDLFGASATRYLSVSEANKLARLTTPNMQRFLVADFPADPFWRVNAARLLESLTQ